MAQMYVVTGINRLTGERGVCSRAYDLERCQKVRDAMAKKNHRLSVWTRLKVEPAIREGNFPFTPPMKSSLSECKDRISVFGNVYFYAPI